MSNKVRLEVLAEHFEEIGDYQMAESILRKLIILCMNDTEPKHQELIKHWFNLALLLEAQNKDYEAEYYLTEAFRYATIKLSPVDKTLLEIQEFVNERSALQIA